MSGTEKESAPPASVQVDPELLKSLIEEVETMRAQLARRPVAAASVEDFKLSSVLEPIAQAARLGVVRALGALKGAEPHEVNKASQNVERVAPGLLDACERNSKRRGKVIGHSINAAINYLTARGI